MQRRELYILFGLAAAVLLSRLPFISHGYGNDSDAWAVASTAESIAKTGEYRMSRPPGHPVQEIVSALLWQTGPVGLNGVTACLSALAAVCFALTLRILGQRAYWVGGLGLAFTPVVWIDSTGLLDHVWALAFILASLTCLLYGRLNAGALLLSLAIGCRATSVLLVAPLSLLLYGHDRRVRTVVRFVAIAVTLGAAAYAPALWKHGGYVFTVWRHGYPKLHSILFMMSVQVWGTVGSAAVLGALGTGAWKRRAALKEALADRSRPLVRLSLSVILLYLVLFLWLPHEPGYLIPLVPFVILLLSLLVEWRVFAAVCLMIALSSLFLGLRQMERIPGHRLDSQLSTAVSVRNIELVLDPVRGPVVYDLVLRKALIDLADRVSKLIRQETGKVVFVTSGISSHFDSVQSNNRDVILTHRLDVDEGRDYVKREFDIYYFRDIALRYNLAATGFDLRAAGARRIDHYPPFAKLLANP